MKKHGWDWACYVTKFKEDIEINPVNHMEVSANIPQVGREEMAVIVNHPEVLPSQKSKEKVINWLGVQEEAVEVFNKQEIDEEIFKEQLFYMKNSVASIKTMVKEC